MRIAMIGAGYVGLVSGACFAGFGHTVMCVDRDAKRVAELSAGRVPIFEPDLAELVAENVGANRLSFGTDLTAAVARADAVFIAVGTPSSLEQGGADLSYVYGAAREIAAALRQYTVIVTKSTVPVGTGDEVERLMREGARDADFTVVSNPEFLREGAAIRDFRKPDRIVVGTTEERAREVMRGVYAPLIAENARIIFTGRRTAELTKYAANAYLATKVTFINEIADLCEQSGADVEDVALGIGLDDRIGEKFLRAGPGFGGSCFPKDGLALIKTAKDHAAPMRIVETVVDVNEKRKQAMAAKIVQACGGSVQGKTIALLGLTFKPNTDDMRESPAIAIANMLREQGASLRGFDPEGMTQARALLPDIDYCDDSYHCITDADALVIVTEWDAFGALDLARVKSLLRAPVFIDLRNMYRADLVTPFGLTYVGVGRGEAR